MLLQTSTDDAAASDVQRVRAAIAQLAPADRDLLVLRFTRDLGTEELAEALGTTPAAVRRRLHDAGWVVEDLAGAAVGATGWSGPARLVGRAPELVEEEAAAGITPLLAARLAAAVAGEPPAADDHWRLHAFVRRARNRTEAVLMTVLVAAVALPTLSTVAQL